MRVSDFSFDLPTELIARFPKVDRTGSRLMILDGDSGAIKDLGFKDILAQLNAGDLLVLIIPGLFLHVCLGKNLLAVKLRCWLSV